MTFKSEAIPHIWMQYVIEGTTIDLYSNILLLMLSLLVPLSIQFSFLQVQSCEIFCEDSMDKSTFVENQFVFCKPGI